MRLLNTSSLALEFFSGERPKYAILSHRWGSEEVTLNDLLSGSAQRMHGFDKLVDSARIAKDAGFDYIWVDTCCIDKSSSAELSEAINSMFKWYRDSALCLAYLSDVQAGYGQIGDSVWFTRGWTLQELIAPRDLRFYDKFWEPLGTKESLSESLGERTGIPAEVLSGEKDMESVPVCCRMAWAAKRVTTRSEDMAYCLLGLFDVNMPLLYGEGSEKSFRRLQETIVKQTDDESIFAWSASPEEVEKRPFWGLLAPSPAYFQDSARYAIPQFKTWRGGSPVEVTNKGLRLSLTLYPHPRDESKTQFLAVLNCSRRPDLDDELAGAFSVALQKLSDFEDQYARILPDQGLHIGDYLHDDDDDANENSHKDGKGGFLDLLETRLIFVRSEPRPTDPVMGFCVSNSAQLTFDFPVNSFNGPENLEGITVVSCEAAEGWQLRRMSTTRRLFFAELTKAGRGTGSGNSALDPSAFAAGSPEKRRLVGSIPVRFESHIKEKGPPPFTSRISARPSYEDPVLLVGFEPVGAMAGSTAAGATSNTTTPPPGFVKPWYSFMEPSMGEDGVAGILSGESPLRPTHVPPGSYKVGVKLAVVSYRFRTFYEVTFVNEEEK
ncbi:hypothetical protein N3K66_007532 [Trichothecium roseum]|uniref:Uncharacterized protein n=1 Tax=Trichothecium roseum TaxID=47278 RepID=A0ACC0UVJ0_9HYPO|nr:hypothetical protein N3K66_007532 [Trichothecium roseum]